MAVSRITSSATQAPGGEYSVARPAGGAGGAPFNRFVRFRDAGSDSETLPFQKVGTV